MRPMKLKKGDILVHKNTNDRYAVKCISGKGLVRALWLNSTYGADLDLYILAHVDTWQSEYTKEYISPEALRSLGFVFGLLLTIFFLFSCAPAHNEQQCIKKAQIIQKMTNPPHNDKLVEVCLEWT